MNKKLLGEMIGDYEKPDEISFVPWTFEEFFNDTHTQDSLVGLNDVYLKNPPVLVIMRKNQKGTEPGQYRIDMRYKGSKIFAGKKKIDNKKSQCLG